MNGLRLNVGVHTLTNGNLLLLFFFFPIYVMNTNAFIYLYSLNYFVFLTWNAHFGEIKDWVLSEAERAPRVDYLISPF